MKVQNKDPSMGILDFSKALERFSLERFEPTPPLREWVEHFWQVSWDLPNGFVHKQSNLSNSSIHIVSESDGIWLYGVPKRLFEREIRGADFAFGVKFFPGTFYSFYKSSVFPFTGKRLPFDNIWHREGALTNRLVREALSGEERRSLFETMLFERLPNEKNFIPGYLKLLEDNPRIVNVGEWGERIGIEERALQRLFRNQVGVGPKEVLKRFRLQQAGERLSKNPETSLATLALELGYADQAHFSKDFKAVSGSSPEEYRKRQVQRTAFRSGGTGTT